MGLWILLGIAGLLVALRFTKFEIRHESVIDAPVDKVWQVIIDFPAYETWNSQLFYLGGQVEQGAQLHLRLAVQGADPYSFKPIVSHLEEEKKFAWLAITGVAGIFDGEHFFELEALPDRKTRLINREEYRGVLSQFMRQLPMMKLAPAGFARMNAEIQARCENR